MTYLSTVITTISSLICLPFVGGGFVLNSMPFSGLFGSDLSSLSAGLSQVLSQLSAFILGLLNGQLIVGPVFTNFMLISILGFVMVKLFLSFGLYKVNLVPNR
jgi:hypothetical protein